MWRKFILLIGIWLIPLSTGIAQDVTFDLDRIRRSTVFILQTQTIGDRPIVTCIGSGTLVSRSGLIATNAHHTVANNDCPGDRIVIALSSSNNQPPIPAYYAEVIQADEGLDLAVLQITQELNGRAIPADELALPFVPLGDSSGVNIDDTITIVGYPDAGNEPVVSIRGTISSFVAEPSQGSRSWIKTDTNVPGTISGGGVYNNRGELIGIPTTVPVVPLVPDATCLQLDDTNNDGLINRSDRCVPIGILINALRPSNALRPLLRSASLGISIETLTTTNLQFEADGDPSFSRLLFSPSETEGMPTTIAASLPTGTDSLYLFFDYRNMTPDTIYELRVTFNGRPSPQFSLPPVRWSGGRSGLWYIGSRGLVWPNGEYQFTLLINGLASQTKSIVIGLPQEQTAIFSDISFGVESLDGQFFAFGNVLPLENIVTARFVHRNVTPGTPWAQIWYYNNTIILQNEIPWENPGLDTQLIRITGDAGAPLLPGRYRLELYLDGLLAATSDFVIAGLREGSEPKPFQNVRLTAAGNPAAAAEARPISTFPSGLSNIYALFNWEQISPGTLWTMRWSVDGIVFYQRTTPWDNEISGRNYIIQLIGKRGIPDGTYRLDILIGDKLIESVEVSVGIGQLPIDRFAELSGVQLNGLIIDAETRDGIAGVTVVIISEDYSVADFTWDQSQIYTLATTDRNGRFQLDLPLQYDTPYSVVIEADGYLPIRQDGIIVDEETENPLNIVLPLSKD
ncbi:MAG: hypothetical protein Kow00117_04190 [Phototrophicales bacterium]